MWLICYQHTNELPLRHLISTLDGPTVLYCGFSDTLGKALANVTDLPIGKFEPVTVGELLISVSQAIVEALPRQKLRFSDVPGDTGDMRPSRSIALMEIRRLDDSR